MENRSFRAPAISPGHWSPEQSADLTPVRATSGWGGLGACEFCVVIPARNEAKRIGRCLESVDRATHDLGAAPREVVVVDDYSSDGTAAVAARPGVTVVRQPEHLGRLAAWSRGVAESTAPVVVFVDADCEVRSDAFRLLLKAFVDPRVGVAAARSVLRPAQSRGVPERAARFSAVILHEIKSQLSNHDFLPIGRLMAVRRDAWAVTDSSLAPCDRLVAHLAKLRGWEIAYLPAAEVLYQPVSTYRALREDYFRTGARRRPALAACDPLPSEVKVRALWIGMRRSPADAAAWLSCRFLLGAERVLGFGRGRTGPAVR
ncbi:MAG: glycosyltransferase [Candidatus Dormibacteria bacterium]